jgi:hypothetical protein
MDVSVTTPETDTGAAFVAGVAAAQAADAAADAAGAEVVAQVAVQDAGEARERATEADVLAMEAHARLDALTAALGDFQDDVVAMVNSTPAPAPVEVSVGVPPLDAPGTEPVTAPPPPEKPKKEKKPKSGWGLDSWFGGR